MRETLQRYKMKTVSQPRRLAGWLCAGAATLALAGCTPGPKYVKPEMLAPNTYKNVPSVASATPEVDWSKALPADAADRGEWWVLFEDKELDVLEAKAATANLNVKAAEASFRQARALVHQAESGFFPTVQSKAGANAQRVAFDRLGIPGIRAESLNRFQFEGTVAWEPDLWGRVRNQVRSDVAGAQASAADLVNVQLSIQAEVAADYFQACGLDEQKRLFQKTIADDQRIVDLTREKLQLGTSSQLDLKQAEAQLDGVLTQEKDLAVQRAQFEDAIAALVGVPASNFVLRPCAHAGALPQIPPGVPSEILQRRPDIAAAERQVAAANAQIGLAKTAFYPSLPLSVGGGVNSNHVSDLFDWPSRVWSLGATATETLFDGGSRKAEVAQARASYDATVANYRQSVLSAFQEVEDNLAATEVLGGEAVTQGSATEASRIALELTRDRLQQGTASALDMMTAENALLANQLTASTIRTRQMTAAVQLIKALGGGWQQSKLPSAKALR